MVHSLPVHDCCRHTEFCGAFYDVSIGAVGHDKNHLHSTVVAAVEVVDYVFCIGTVTGRKYGYVAACGWCGHVVVVNFSDCYLDGKITKNAGKFFLYINLDV